MKERDADRTELDEMVAARARETVDRIMRNVAVILAARGESRAAAAARCGISNDGFTGTLGNMITNGNTSIVSLERIAYVLETDITVLVGPALVVPGRKEAV